MSSVKALLYTHKTLSNGEHPILIQIIKDRKRKTISLGHSCSEKLWDFKEGIPKMKHPNFKEISLLIDKKKAEAKTLVLNLEIEKRDYSLDEFGKKFKNKGKKTTVIKFTELLIANFLKADNVGNANAYKDAKRELVKFRNGIDFTFSDIDQSFLRKYEQYFRERKLKENSISVYFRSLRSIFNKAIAEGYAKRSDYPFEEFKISKFNTETQRRAISKAEIKLIENFETKEGLSLFNSKYYFLFSFYTMGMNFSDIAKLKWENISGDRVTYTRSKTGKKYSVKLLPPAIEIIDYYKNFKRDEFVFPILEKAIHQTAISIDNRIEKMTKATNKDLKEIAKQVKIEINLTTYVARHSWATILKRAGVSTSIISEGLGHHTEATTKIYLDSFENKTIDDANEVLMNL